jgi:hypothetical protein
MAASDYTSLATYRSFRQYKTANTKDDALISMLIDPVSREIDGHCHRIFWPETRTDLYDYQEQFKLMLREDLFSVTAITHGDGEVLNPMYYILYPLMGPPYRWITINRHYGYGFRWVRTDQAAISVTGMWGFLDKTGNIPSGITLACNAWINYLVQATKNAGIKSTSIGDYSVSYSAALDYLKNGPPNEVAGILARFKKVNIASNVKW